MAVLLLVQRPVRLLVPPFRVVPRLGPVVRLRVLVPGLTVAGMMGAVPRVGLSRLARSLGLNLVVVMVRPLVKLRPLVGRSPKVLAALPRQTLLLLLVVGPVQAGVKVTMGARHLSSLWAPRLLSRLVRAGMLGPAKLLLRVVVL